MTQLKVLTLKDYNPHDKKIVMDSLSFVKFLTKDEFAVIDDEVLYAIIEVYGEKSKDEIMRMVDRGQIFQSQAESVLKDDFLTVSKRVLCEWDEI